VAQALAFVDVPAFIVFGKVLEYATVTAPDLKDPRARGNIAADEAIGQVVLVDLQVADGRIGITNVVRLERQTAKQLEMGEFGIGEASDVGWCGPAPFD